MTTMSPLRNSQRKFEKAIHDAICSDLPIAYGDAQTIDIGLFEDENYKLVAKIFQDSFGHPSKQPPAQEIAKDVQIFYQNQGLTEEDAGRLADKIEDFKGQPPNTLLLRQAIKALKTDTTTPNFLNGATSIDFPNAYDALRSLCQNSQSMGLHQLRQECIDILNATHTVVMDGSKALVCEMTHDHTGKLVYKFYPVEALRKLYSNLNYQYKEGKRIKTENCFDVWFKNLERNTHSGIVFDPSGNASTRFLNLWTGFLVEPIESDHKLDRIMWHLRNVICGGNDDHFHYLLAWFAHLVQKPEEKSGVCVVLKSDARGTGKSTVSKLLEALLGEHCITVQDIDQLLGHFNAHLANKLLISAEEVCWSGSTKDSGKLKTLITEPSIVIEGKGKDSIKLPSYHRYMLITNNEWAVPQRANERRFWVLEVSDVKAKDRDYFDALYVDINDSEAIGQFLYFLQHYDISNFDLRNAPFTDAGQQQVWESLEMHEQWLKDLLESGELVDGNVCFNLELSQEIPKSSFYNSYLDYCNRRGFRGKTMSHALLGKYLKKVIKIKNGSRPSTQQKMPRPNNYDVECLDILNGRFGRFYGYR